MKRPLCFFCLIFVAAAVLYMWFVPVPLPDYEEQDKSRVTAEGTVYQKEHRITADQEVLVIYLTSVQFLDESKFIPQNQIENIVCYIDKGAEPLMGSRVRVDGRLRSFSRATNPGEFDMRKYYRIMKLDFKVEDAAITAYSREHDRFKENLYRIRKYFAGVLDQCFEEKYANIMKAILLGEKSSLDKEIKELYQEAGIIHILAISGLHISVIGMGIYRLLRRCFLPVSVSAVTAGIFIVCYGLMVGMSASAVRAIIMFVMRLAADMAGRTYDMLTALCLAAILLLADQPLYAMHGGFLFSFGAVGAIGVLLPILYERKRQQTKTKESKLKKKVKNICENIRQAAFSSIAVTLVTLPVHLYFYFQFPLYSVFLNLLIIPLMTIVMYDGLFCMAIGGIWPMAAQSAAVMDEAVLWFYEKSCLITGQLPFGTYVGGQPAHWQLALYSLMLVVLLPVHKRVPQFWKLQWILAALMILTVKGQDQLRLTMIDVGQGDSIHIATETGSHYLIDGGSSSKSKTAEYQIIPYLKSQKASHLKAIFVTHADSDHINGIITLLEEAGQNGIEVDCLILPKISVQSREEGYTELVSLAEKANIPVQYMSRGQSVTDGRLTLSCLHPKADYRTKEPNEYSLVLSLTYGNITGLLTGDVEGKGEEDLKQYMRLNGSKRRITFLKAAHHGSANSTDKEFLEMTKPMLVLISCGRKNSYGHPHQELLERVQKVGARIAVTKEIGAITLISDGKKVTVFGFLDDF